MVKHICRYRAVDAQAPFSKRVRCELCGEYFLPVTQYICHCQGTVTYFLSEKVEVGHNRRCPIYDYEVDISSFTTGSISPNDRSQEQEGSTSPPTNKISGGSVLDKSHIQPSTRPFLDRTAKIGIMVLASFILLPLFATILPQIALPSLLLALLGLGLLWALFELLARLFLWPFQDWHAATPTTSVSTTVAPEARARRWFRHQALFVFLAGFISGAIVVALIAEAFEGVRATILELATVSGLSVALAAVLFYAGLAITPSVKNWLNARSRQGGQPFAERVALRAGLARAMSLGIATVVVLLFVPALLQPMFETEFPLATQILVGLVINMVGDVFILLSEGVTKHLWPDTERLNTSLASLTLPSTPLKSKAVGSSQHNKKH